jgi:hypothetical protein
MESLKHRLHYFPFEKFFPSEVRFQNGNGNGDGDGDGGPSYGGDFTGYSFDLGTDADKNLAFDINLADYTPGPGPTPNEAAPSPDLPGVIDITTTLSDYEQAVAGQKTGYTFLGAEAQKGIAGLINNALSTVANFLTHGLTAVGISKGIGVIDPGGKIMGLFTKDQYGNLMLSSTPSASSTPSTPSLPSKDSPLSELSGFPSPGGGGEHPLQAGVPAGATPLSTSSYVEPDLVQAEIKALAKYLSSPTEQSLTDVLNQTQFAYSSDQAKEEAKKETQSAQLASMLPIMGIILIGVFVAFRKGARA